MQAYTQDLLPRLQTTPHYDWSQWGNGTHNLHTVGSIVIITASAQLYVYTNEWQGYRITKYTAYADMATLFGLDVRRQSLANLAYLRATVDQPLALSAFDININVLQWRQFNKRFIHLTRQRPA